MALYSEEQSMVEYVAISGQGFLETLAALGRDTQRFLMDNPFLLGFAVILAVVFFGVTRPRAR